MNQTPDHRDPLEILLGEVDAVYDRMARSMFNSWVALDESNFRPGSDMCRACELGVFELLFEHFEEQEDYEICAELQEMHWRILAFAKPKTTNSCT